uniref:Uncharacterized protein n=1 Tax=Arundo donax TaxID=35708 RepID=A0A0A9GUM2_ARUDO
MPPLRAPPLRRHAPPQRLPLLRHALRLRLHRRLPRERACTGRDRALPPHAPPRPPGAQPVRIPAHAPRRLRRRCRPGQIDPFPRLQERLLRVRCHKDLPS